MGDTNDLARQRLTHFLAARLKARKREADGAERAGPDSTFRALGDGDTAQVRRASASGRNQQSDGTPKLEGRECQH